MLREELEVEKLAKQEAMSRSIRTSLQMFNDNLPYIENYIRKTLGITDPEGMAAEVQRMYNEAVARYPGESAGGAGVRLCGRRLQGRGGGGAASLSTRSSR